MDKEAMRKAFEAIRHTLMTGLAHNPAIAALNELEAAIAHSCEGKKELVEALKQASWGLRNLLLDDSPSAVRERLRLIEQSDAALSRHGG